MSDWTDGYLTDVEYSHAYNRELNPLVVRLLFLVAGLSPPMRFGTACELGFGQGLSINLHAAGSTTEWWGTDFNPAQVGFAHELGAASGVDVKLFDEAFADFVHRRDLPDFDFIGMHGIWSWISEENQAAITDFIRRKLKVRGVLYNGYNVAPGWASFAPVRHLMAEYAALAGTAPGGRLASLTGTLQFVERFLAVKPAFLRANPRVPDRFDAIKGKDPQYLVHEFLNGHWKPIYFTTMVEAMAPARVAFACPASYIEHYDALNVTPEQWSLLQSVPDGPFRQSLRDFMVNQQFRRDYWAKGAGRLTSLQQAEALAAERLVLVSHRPKVELKVRAPLGEVALHAPVYEPILDFFADHQPRSIGEVAMAMKPRNINFKQLIEAVVVMAGAGHLQPAQDVATIDKVRPHAKRLNDGILERARSVGDLNMLASPVTGGGIAATRIVQNFLLGQRQGRKTPQELSEFVIQLLDAQGQKLVREGKTIESADETMAVLMPQATGFVDEQFPILKALQIE
jgi:hypothetical protein